MVVHFLRTSSNSRWARCCIPTILTLLARCPRVPLALLDDLSIAGGSNCQRDRPCRCRWPGKHLEGSQGECSGERKGKTLKLHVSGDDLLSNVARLVILSRRQEEALHHSYLYICETGVKIRLWFVIYGPGARGYKGYETCARLRPRNVVGSASRNQPPRV